MSNRFKHLLAQQFELFDPLKQQDQEQGQKKHEKEKTAIGQLKLSLRTFTSILTGIGTWALPDDYTRNVTSTIQNVLSDTIRYNNMYLQQNEEQQKKTQLPNPEEYKPSPNQTIQNMMDSINKTIQKNQ